jgi:hypothetical protein
VPPIRVGPHPVAGQIKKFNYSSKKAFSIKAGEISTLEFSFHRDGINLVRKLSHMSILVKAGVAEPRAKGAFFARLEKFLIDRGTAERLNQFLYHFAQPPDCSVHAGRDFMVSGTRLDEFGWPVLEDNPRSEPQSFTVKTNGRVQVVDDKATLGAVLKERFNLCYFDRTPTAFIILFGAGPMPY